MQDILMNDYFIKQNFKNNLESKCVFLCYIDNTHTAFAAISNKPITK